jgi:hypothetical protein
MNEHAVEGLDWDPSAPDAEQIGRALLMRLDGLDRRLQRSQDQMLALLDEHIGVPEPAISSWSLPDETAMVDAPVIVEEVASPGAAPVPASLRGLVWAPLPSMLPTVQVPVVQPARLSRRKGLFAMALAAVAVVAAVALLDLV